jgi:hypothetical protein
MADKKVELINDERLTPTMERIRSGSKQLFRERDPSNRTFISVDNCDVCLEHEKVSVYAELIEGEWWWMEGCAECNGDPRDWMTYVECDEHNRCRTCGTKSKDLAPGVTKWGGKPGWQCDNCKQDQIRKAKESFAKKELEDYHFKYNEKAICPHCGCQNHIDLGEINLSESEFECGFCESVFMVEVHLDITYSTAKKK